MSAGLRLVSVITDSKQVVGYKVANMATWEIETVAVNAAVELARKGMIVNATLDGSGALRGVGGAISRLPQFDTNGKLVGPARITIVQVLQKKNNTRVYMVMDAYGRMKPFNYNDTLKLISEVGATNAKIVDRDGKKIISAIQGNFDTVEEKEGANVKEPSSSSSEENKKFYTPYRYITNEVGYTLLKILDELAGARKKLQSGEVSNDLYEKDSKSIVNWRYLAHAICLRYDVHKMARKLIKSHIEGKIGARTKKHYPSAIKYLQSLKDGRVDELFGQINYSSLKLRYAWRDGRYNCNYWGQIKKSDTGSVGMAMLVIDYYASLVKDFINYSVYGSIYNGKENIIKTLNSSKAAKDYIAKSKFGNVNKLLSELVSKELSDKKSAKNIEAKVDIIDGVRYLGLCDKYKKSLSNSISSLKSESSKERSFGRNEICRLKDNASYMHKNFLTMVGKNIKAKGEDEKPKSNTAYDVFFNASLLAVDELLSMIDKTYKENI